MRNISKIMSKISFLALIFSFSSCTNLSSQNSKGIESSSTNSSSSSFFYKHVIVVGVDGMGNYCSKTSCPFLEKTMESGSYTFTGISESPTISAQNWGSMLMGVSPTIHKLTNGIIETTEISSDIQYPSIFTYIRKQIPSARLACFSGYNAIYNGIVDHGQQVINYTGQDNQICEKAQYYILENEPTFMFIQFESVDASGHGSGYGSADYLSQISTVDSYISKIYDACVKERIIDSTLFMVVSDHGGINKTHGGDSTQEKEVFFGAVGETVTKNTIVSNYRNRDVAANVLYALNIESPKFSKDGFSSQVLPELFSNQIVEPYKNIDD